MEGFTTLTSRAVVLAINNIDTDQIIPARFLKTTDRSGLGSHLFADWRYEEDGSLRPEFVLNRPEARGAQILLAGDNFGCGSSREHAPWALVGFGFHAVISTSFADIFSSNALKNRLLPVRLAKEHVDELLDLLSKAPQSELTVNLEAQSVLVPGGHAFPFPIDAFSRLCLLNGVDELGYLLGYEKQISAYEEVHDR
jgi:3-isopropylmalate/(R)-2-methylmalate dehydratase small subunit